MQLTPEILMQFAETTVDKLARMDASVHAAYLRGSVVMPENPLLGGTTDIDLVFIHSWTPKVGREILRLTDDVHLDIVHHSQSDYQQGRELRVDPWMGPALNNAKPLYDPQHFIDFIQATVRGQFYRPDHVLARARNLAEQSRQQWLELSQLEAADQAGQMRAYLQAVANAANAIALLSGEPLPERRILLEFPGRAQSIGRPGLSAGLLGLLGGPCLPVAELETWLARWQASMGELPDQERPLDLHPYRYKYYRSAFEAMLASGQPLALLWPLLHTWTLAVVLLPAHAVGRQDWQAFVRQLEMWGSAFPERVAALDAFLDQVDEILLEWERRYGG
ncbi:MAG: hypothetical protein JW862_11125 [Anaerolineales bacterium]|nr:hypothetical protein [Anaerolineales bacterium]